MAKRERIYSFYLEPKDSHTNKAIALQLGADTKFYDSPICADGKPHNLFDCDKEFINAVFESEEDLNLKFDVFTSEGASSYPQKIRKLPKKIARRIFKAKTSKSTVKATH